MNQKIRKLGLGETWLALLHDRAEGTAQTTLICEVEGQLSKKTFEIAVNHLLLRYPQLNYILQLEADGYYFVKKNKDINEEIEIKTEYFFNNDRWKESASLETNKTLDSKKSLVRFKLFIFEESIHSCIIVTIHHSISDGLSLVAMVDTLLFNFANINSTLPLAANPGFIEKLYPLQEKSSSQLIKTVEVLNKIKPYTWKHQIKSELKDRSTYYKFFNLSVDKLKNFQQVAKNNNLSINSILNAAMLLSASTQLKHEFQGALSTPINLRNYTNGKANSDDVGFFVQVINTIHATISAHTSIVVLAKEYNQQLRDRLALFIPQIDYNFNEVKNGMKEVWNVERDYFCYNFMVTNLGMLHFKNESNHFRIKSFRFITCRRGADNNMMLYVNSTSQGCFYTFGYPFPAITHEWANNFIADFNRRIDEFIDE